jgi:hypothetical protein
LFLPTGLWSSRRHEIEQELQRLLIWHALLGNLMRLAQASDESCTWYLMAEAAQNQLDRDLDALHDWLDDAEQDPAVPPSSVDRAPGLIATPMAERQKAE